MATFWLFAVASLVFAIVLLRGLWLWSAILYVLTGVAWSVHESQLLEITFSPPVYSRPQLWILVALVLTWPRQVVFAAWRKLQALFIPSRFAVLWGVGVAIEKEHGIKEFRRREDAVTFAQAKSAQIDAEVIIQDRAKSHWNPMVGRTISVNSLVLPSGEIKKLT
jgi:hypothetical protein